MTKRADLEQMSNEQLVSLRVDLGREMQVHSTKQNRLRLTIEDVTSVLRLRGAPGWKISDHAVIRYLERRKGLDIDGVRAEIADKLNAAKADGTVSLRKGDAVAYGIDGMMYVVTRDNLVVSCYPEREGDAD